MLFLFRHKSVLRNKLWIERLNLVRLLHLRDKPHKSVRIIFHLFPNLLFDWQDQAVKWLSLWIYCNLPKYFSIPMAKSFVLPFAQQNPQPAKVPSCFGVPQTKEYLISLRLFPANIQNPLPCKGHKQPDNTYQAYTRLSDFVSCRNKNSAKMQFQLILNIGFLFSFYF